MSDRMKNQGSYQYGSSATQAGATQFQYPPFNVGDHGTWSNSNNGNNNDNSYSNNNNSWGGSQQHQVNHQGGHQHRKQYENNYYNRDYQQDGVKNVEQGMQGLDIGAGSGRGGMQSNTAHTQKHSTENHSHTRMPPKNDQKEAPKKMTWASIASQPAKPQINTTSTTVKKKGPGMPPPPMVPGKHNMDIGTWDSPAKNPSPPIVPTPPPVIQAPVNQPKAQNAGGQPGQPAWPTPGQASDHIPPVQQHGAASGHQNSHQGPPNHYQGPPPNHHQGYQNQGPRGNNMHHNNNGNGERQNYPGQRPYLASAGPHQHNPMHHQYQAGPPPVHQSQSPPQHQGPPPNARNFDRNDRNDRNERNDRHFERNDRNDRNERNDRNDRNDRERNDMYQPQQHHAIAPPPAVVAPSIPAAQLTAAAALEDEHNPVLEQLRDKNDYNPPQLDLSEVDNARFFVIKSYSEDDIHRSIKYEIWCSTEHGNKRLDQAYREQGKENSVIYLFFSVNGSGHFCGIAQMITPVDYNSHSSVWSQDKWKGSFKVKWIYVKDVPNTQLRHIRLENNENKSVTNSRDTQEVPNVQGVMILRIIHAFKHTTSIFDDFTHYEDRQQEEDTRKGEPESNYKPLPLPPSHHSSHNREGNNQRQQFNESRSYDREGSARDYHGPGGFDKGYNGYDKTQGYQGKNYNNGGGYNDYKPSYNNGRGGGGFRPNNNYRDDRRSNEFRSNGDQSGGGSYGRKDYGDRADEDSTSGAYQRDFNRGSYRDNRDRGDYQSRGRGNGSGGGFRQQN